MKQTNPNPLFISLVSDFAHLISSEAQTKGEFMEKVKNSRNDMPLYKTALFYQAAQRSEFDTIRREGDSILLNQ